MQKIKMPKVSTPTIEEAFELFALPLTLKNFFLNQKNPHSKKIRTTFQQSHQSLSNVLLIPYLYTD